MDVGYMVWFTVLKKMIELFMYIAGTSFIIFITFMGFMYAVCADIEAQTY